MAKKKQTHDLFDNNLVVGSRVTMEYSQLKGTIVSINKHDKVPEVKTYTVLLDPIVVLGTTIEK